MARFISTHTAMKKRKCSRCLGPIEPGERYVQVVVTPGDTDIGNTGWLRTAEHESLDGCREPGPPAPEPPPDSTHECPRDSCTRRVPPDQLMCLPDWHALPRPFRNAVWAAWQDGRGAGTPAHTAAIRAAIEAVNRTGRNEP